MNAIHKELKTHARSEARGLGAQLGIVGFILITSLSVIFVWLESFRYFEPNTKFSLLLFIGVSTVVILTGILTYYWLLKNQKLGVTHSEKLASLIGNKLPSIGDRVLNAVQLDKSLPAEGISEELHQAAIQAGLEAVEQVPSKLLFPLHKIKTYLWRVSVGLGMLVLLYFINFQKTNAAISRLSQPQAHFEYPLPLSLTLSTTTDLVLAGDTLQLTGHVSGREISKLELLIQTRKDTSIYSLPVIDQQYSLPLEHVMTSFSARARVVNERSWEPWEIIESEPLSIQVTNRPLVQDLNLRIRPPSYTKLPLAVHTRDILDISGFRGSTVSINGLTSKEVESVNLHFESGRVLSAEISDARFKTSFTLKESDQIWFELVDDEGVKNLDPLKYPVYVADDLAPMIRVMVPGQDVVMGENMQIPIRLKLDDDFGFSKLELNYQLQHPDYLMADTNTYTEVIELPDAGLASQEFNTIWDIQNISIMPEDAIQYWFTVWDNNTVDGPRHAKSKKWLARLPSLDEIFEEIAQGNENVKEEQEEILDIVKEIRQKVDELAMEVQKDPNLSWEQQQEASEAMEQVENLKDQLENISQQLDEMVSAAEEQNLFSNETLDKYSELQQLMEELITPELQETMKRLQEAMEQDDPKEMEAALEDFQASMENFQKNLERTLEIFQQVELEQKIDELTTRLNELADRQEALSEEMDELNPDDASQIEEQIKDDFDKAEQAAQDLEELLDQNDDLSSQAVQDLQAQMNEAQIEANLSEAASQMQQGQMGEAKPPAEAAAKSLREMAFQSNQMRNSMQQQMMDQVLSEFRSILLKTLGLSQKQEALEQPTAKISPQSSLLRDYADSQMNLLQGLQQISGDLKELGDKTFAVSQSMGRTLGAVQAQMQNSISQMEARNPGKSSQSQAAARTSLNRMAQQIASSMESLEQSGESSGFSDYMKQLGQMAGQQQGLNQQTMMQLGAGSQSMMQKLAQQQLQLREALSQIEKGMGSDSRMLGDLGKIGDEMEAVAKKLQGKRPTQKIHEQQERILSRLLDAQRSATQRDFSKKRKSETAGENQFSLGNKSLPDDLGEARNVLYEELIFSLKQDYDREEQALIREYLNLLEAELNE